MFAGVEVIPNKLNNMELLTSVHNIPVPPATQEYGAVLQSKPGVVDCNILVSIKPKLFSISFP